MEFVCYSDWHQLPADAGNLFADGERQSLFLSRGWFENLLKHGLDNDQALRFACVVDRGELLAILPMRTHRHGGWHALSNFYASLFSVLLADKQQQPVIDCLAQGLNGLAWQSLRLEPVADDDAAINQLQQAMERLGIEAQRAFHFANWSHRTRGDSFEHYFAQRPSRLRNTVARKWRKLRRERALEFRLFTDNQIEKALLDYGAVYQASWKDGERFRHFVPSLVRMAANAGWLRLGVLYIDGRPAAAQIWFVVHSKASIFRLVYDEHWRHYSPGTILTAWLMEHVIDRDGVESIDFLTGNERYKQDWMSDQKDRTRLVLVKQTQPVASKNRLGALLQRFAHRSGDSGLFKDP